MVAKYRDIVKRLRAHAKAHNLDIFFKEGSCHTKVCLGDRWATIPLHREVNELTTTAIYKQLGVEP